MKTSIGFVTLLFAFTCCFCSSLHLSNPAKQLPGSSNLHATPLFHPETCKIDLFSTNESSGILVQHKAHVLERVIPVAQDELPIGIPSSPLSSTSWEIRPSPGKGLGVFAKSPISAGQRIMVEAPLFAITPPPFVPGKGYELSAMAASVDAAVASLSPADRNVFHSCHAHYLPGEATATEEPGSGADVRRNRNMVIFRSNAYTLTNGSVAMFPQIARINHACRPNAANVWSAASDRRIIWAARDIAAGEEVTVTYAPLLKARSDRQARLAPYGFTCDCEACRDNDPEGTDRSRVRMGRLLAELEERLARSTSGAANKRLLPKALELVQLLEKEHMMDYLPNAYHLAAELAHRMEDSAAAMTWSEKALQLHKNADEISHAAMGEQSYLDRVRM